MSELNSEIQNVIIALIADITGAAMEELDLDTSVETVEVWDSVAHINIMLSVESECGVTIDPENAIELTSVRALVEFLTKQG